MNSKNLEAHANLLIEAILRGEYRGHAYKNGKEGFFDVALLAYLTAKGYQVDRQALQTYAGKKGAIDFRIGPHNPIYVELACRTNGKKPSLGAGSNKTELNKLRRISPTSRGRRYLLLLDFAKHALDKVKLSADYKTIRFHGPNQHHYPVTVIYCHRDTSYHFRWKP